MRAAKRMIRGKLTPKEAEILHQLLAEKGITTYEIFGALVVTAGGLAYVFNTKRKK